MASKNSEYFKESLKFGKRLEKDREIPRGEVRVDSPMMDLRYQRPKESAGKVEAKPIPPSPFGFGKKKYRGS